MTFHILGTAEMQERIAGGDARGSNGDVTQEEFTEAVVTWVKTRKVAEALSCGEIGKMRAFDRMDAFRKSLILNISLYYKDNPQADVAPGVLILVTLMSDNERGACQFSHDTIAQILHRHRTTIASAMIRLKKSGLVHSDKGRTAAYPIIPRALVVQYNHVVWLANALKPVPTSQQVDTQTCADKPTGDLCRQANRLDEPVPTSQQVRDQPVPTSQHNFTKDLLLTPELEDRSYSLSDLQDRKPDCARAEESAATNPLEDVSGRAIAEAAANAVKPKRQKKAKATNGRPNYSDDFVAFWLAYPRHPNMSKANAFVQWEHLDAEDRDWATRAADAYRAQQLRKAQQESLSPEDIAHKTKHAERFLKDRRFDAYREYVESKQAETPQNEPNIGGLPKTRVIDLVADFFRHGASRWTARVSEALGAAPGSTGCSIPEDVIMAGRAMAGV
jgi:hypothetical protein